ncbi:apical rhoptry neck protein [Plasmodium sp. gorilla clade G2]|uniref:apical rhoptry neck protein n=1 Tax=Plasmodium sp. gorilla clade G2 TaxID=880535 RepID=UPI000D21530D|nr:apical rhoptry neck protein [Plasmodium sp. gorilla clade G2]SOV11633.1 apical rhoptry neck protein [Plasmodium sp. gorilla clade G2]
MKKIYFILLILFHLNFMNCFRKYDKNKNNSLISHSINNEEKNKKNNNNNNKNKKNDNSFSATSFLNEKNKNKSYTNVSKIKNIYIRGESNKTTNIEEEEEEEEKKNILNNNDKETNYSFLSLKFFPFILTSLLHTGINQIPRNTDIELYEFEKSPMIRHMLVAEERKNAYTYMFFIVISFVVVLLIALFIFKFFFNL